MFQRISSKIFLIGVLTGISLRAWAIESGDSSWEDWIRAEKSAAGATSSSLVVQNRAIQKSGRFQLVGPLIGLSDRHDFYSTYVVTAGVRYHFSETQAWELIRLNTSISNESSLANQIREQTSFAPDVRLSRFQVGSSYVYTPIYGKYSWDETHLIYFDIYGTAGAGARFSYLPGDLSASGSDVQPFAELGIGMNHYLGSRRISLVTEFRERFYREQRTDLVSIFESNFQVGLAWFF